MFIVRGSLFALFHFECIILLKALNENKFNFALFWVFAWTMLYLFLVFLSLRYFTHLFYHLKLFVISSQLSAPNAALLLMCI